MEHQVSIENVSEDKLYSEKAIWLGTFLGGPLAGGYLISRNFKALNDPSRCERTIAIAIFTTVLIMVIALSIPEDVNIPNIILPAIYTSIAYFLVKRHQGKELQNHIDLGGYFYSPWRAVVVGIIGTAVTTLPILFYALISMPQNTEFLPVKRYGPMQHEISYRQSNVSEAEIDRIARKFTATAFFDQAITKYVHVNKDKGAYEISIFVIDGIENDLYGLDQFIFLHKDMQRQFPANDIRFKLVVDNLENVVKVIE